MVEANKAYALGDEQQLRDILDAWERSPEAVQGDDPEAMRLRLVRRIGQIEDQLEVIAGDLAALKESPLGKLKTMVDEAAAGGKDLVRDMISRGLTLDQTRAANPTQGFRARYGTDTGPWTTDMFVEAVYRSLVAGAKR